MHGNDDNPEHGEKAFDENGRELHSGFDFIDEDPRYRRHKRGSGDPFDDSHRSEYGATWYQDPLGDERTGYSRRSRNDMTTYGDEQFDDGRAEYLDGRHDRQSMLDPFDDGMTAALADNLKTGADPSTAYGGGSNPFVPPTQPVPARSLPSNYGEDAMIRQDVHNAYDGSSAPALSRAGSARQSALRPDTTFSQAETFASGDFYNIYGAPPSRPATQHDHPNPITSEVPPTPATSSLLPWLNKKTETSGPAPPVPPIDRETHRVPRASKPQKQAKESFRMLDDGGSDPSRLPPAAVMAQTPMGADGGWQGVIPPFR